MEKVVAGIVSFNPDLSLLLQEVKTLMHIGMDIIVVDNGSSNVNDISSLLEDLPICFIKNGENLGVAHALNEIFEKAIDMQAKAVLTLDQDSLLPDNLLSLITTNFFENNIGIVCPSISYYGKSQKKQINMLVEVKWAITSGSLIKVDVWKKIGGFNDLLFIDYVDFDFCYRIRSKGYKIYQHRDVVFEHRLGENERRNFLFWKISIISHSPIRYYYKTRNVVFLRRKKELSLLSCLKIILRMKIDVLFESETKRKKRMIKKGIRDGKMLYKASHYIKP